MSKDPFPTPATRELPTLMTAAEAAAYLRLTDGFPTEAQAVKTLETLVTKGQIRPCVVGPFTRFARFELNRFIHVQTERKSQHRDSKQRTAAYNQMEETMNAPIQDHVQKSPKSDRKGGKVVRRVP